MFTGLVEDVGTVLRADRRSNALVLAVKPASIPLGELVVGESICHDGACLTVTDIARDSFGVLAGLETLERTTLGALRVGKRVNLERSMKLGDRLGGHWVTGHIDGTGEPPASATSDRTSCSPCVRRVGPASLRDVPMSPDGGVIADYHGPVDDPAALAVRLSSTPGVVDHGLFPPQMVATVLIGRGESADRIDFTSGA